MTIFNKPPFSISEHISQWISRGLLIPDLARAHRYLSVISYYRFSAYTLPFQVGDPEHHFRAGTTFEAVLDLYIFDRQLRLLILDAIERIEVALRARMTNVLAENHGSYAYLKKDIFDTRYNHDWLIRQIRRKCDDSQAETFIKHYRAKYTDPDLQGSLGAFFSAAPQEGQTGHCLILGPAGHCLKILVQGPVRFTEYLCPPCENLEP